MSLDALLGGTGQLRIGSGDRSFHVSRAWLENVLNGSPVDPTAKGASSSNAFKGAKWLARNKADFGLPDSVDAELLYLTVPTGAERRAAKKINLDPLALAVWARVLWGHSLDDEARARAGDEATPQARGRITRLLVEELSKARREQLDVPST